MFDKKNTLPRHKIKQKCHPRTINTWHFVDFSPTVHICSKEHDNKLPENNKTKSKLKK